MNDTDINNWLLSLCTNFTKTFGKSLMWTMLPVKEPHFADGRLDYVACPEFVDADNKPIQFQIGVGTITILKDFAADYVWQTMYTLAYAARNAAITDTNPNPPIKFLTKVV